MKLSLARITAARKVARHVGCDDDVRRQQESSVVPVFAERCVKMRCICIFVAKTGLPVSTNVLVPCGRTWRHGSDIFRQRDARVEHWHLASARMCGVLHSPSHTFAASVVVVCLAQANVITHDLTSRHLTRALCRDAWHIS